MYKYVLTIIHGSKEHQYRYKDFIISLERKGIKAVTGDLATHGVQSENSIHNFSFDEMLESSLKIIDKSKKLYPNHKHIILGHSMGSFIVKYITYKNIRVFDGIILSGTNNLDGFPLKIALMFSKIGNSNKVSKINEFLSYGLLTLKTKLNGFGNSWLSTNKENILNYDKDPLCGNNFSNKSLYSMFTFIKECNSKKTLLNFKNKKIPQMIIYGEKDPVSNFGKDINKLTKRHNKYGINNHKIISYPNCKHEILLDIMKEKVEKDIIKFIKNI
ncbi:MAG: alpha/beta hydrolase [Mycoplasmataceae bacterium]|nr:alpha/beta hydrolase [Mycoplasmataceae bacterium]